MSDPLIGFSPVDLVQGGVSHAAGVVADAGPVDRREGLGLGQAGDCDQEREADRGGTHSRTPGAGGMEGRGGTSGA